MGRKFKIFGLILGLIAIIFTTQLINSKETEENEDSGNTVISNYYGKDDTTIIISDDVFENFRIQTELALSDYSIKNIVLNDSEIEIMFNSEISGQRVTLIQEIVEQLSNSTDIYALVDEDTLHVTLNHSLGVDSFDIYKEDFTIENQGIVERELKPKGRKE